MRKTKEIQIRLVDEDVIDTMKLVVQWHDMRYMCLSRSSCIGCPYHGKMLCNRYSTEDIMLVASAIFRDYLENG